MTLKYYNAVSAALRQAILPLAWRVLAGVTGFYWYAQTINISEHKLMKNTVSIARLFILDYFLLY